MNPKDVQKLAQMARITINEEEAITLGSSFDDILTYVDQIQKLSTESSTVAMPALYNITREDKHSSHASFSHEILLENMPERKDDYLKVRKIL